MSSKNTHIFHEGQMVLQIVPFYGYIIVRMSQESETGGRGTIVGRGNEAPGFSIGDGVDYSQEDVIFRMAVGATEVEVLVVVAKATVTSNIRPL